MALSVSKLRPYLPIAVFALIAVGAIAIAWTFAAITLRHTRPMGLPLDDSYIYLTYAKQFGRAQPFTYFPGGGYSAGSTSVLWPMLLAPFWTLGARGHALVWVSFVICAALYALTVLGVARIVQRIAGPPRGELAGVIAGVVLLGIAPFAWTALSGMEVAFASALLVGSILLLLDQPSTGRPSRRLILCLSALSLSRPEAMLLVLTIVVVAAVQRLRQHDARSAAWWGVPLIAPALWLLANKAFAGQLFPNTGVAKSQFYLPGFDWGFWFSSIWTLSRELFEGLFWDRTSPLVWPRLIAVLWIAGAIRVVAWSVRERKALAGLLVLGGPFVLMLAVISSSGLWNFQNYRYISPAFPLLVITVGCAFVPISIHTYVRRAFAIGAVVAALAYARAALPGLLANAKNFAQGAMDTNTQVVAIGRYLHRKLPDASVMFHDAGAIAYYGDGRVYDMLGLVTNFQAGIANHGPGARFEFLESLPEAKRPTHFAYYPGWLGTTEWYGDVLLHTPLRPSIAPNRHVGDADMQVIVARWDHVGTAERPLDEHAGWAMVDRIDLAHLAAERDHGWQGALGRRKLRDPTARWSFVGREVGSHGLLLDGGRTIRGGRERFTIRRDPAKPVRLILRTGGERGYPFHEMLAAPVPVQIRDDRGQVLATETLPAPPGRFVEVVFELPAGISATLQTMAPGPYRAFHWFVLQPAP